ncbi:transglutaminase TgpA family protein [Paenibacillus rigui]|uniref:Cysteine protease n=1 Tax=Paenibacillus rigui TaxID=554312 RepID=A0A229URW8_9BACL|nr:transglutaminase domain-containing protein [Paenibacillus rigui]OXM86168.1 cysteine protease [Paenibacillus rigui]
MNESISWWRRLFLLNWTHRLTVLLVGVLLLQFVYWIAKEDGVWLPETVVIVELTLLVTFLLEHIPRLHWLLRGALQVVLIVVINAMVLEQFHVRGPMQLSSFFSSRLFLNLYELTPYLWFGLGAWVLYLTLLWWVEVKWRVYALMIVSVLAMCIRDSFSSIYLWPQVAMTVGCGLFLLILCHLQRLRKKDPDTWSYLADYPTSIAVPVIALISLTVMIGTIMPEVGPLLTDPYTAWRAYRGEPVNFTTGKGIEVAPAVSSADTSSGYSRNDTALGSGFQFDYTPVMTVDTTHRSYWRGETRSLYNGKGWDLGESDKRAGASAVRADTVLTTDPRSAGSKMRTVEVKQTVTMLNEEPYPVLFGALNVQKVVDLNGIKTGFEGLQWVPMQSELRYNEQRQAYPKTYIVISQMPVIDEDVLRKTSEPANRAELAEYLQLPDNVPARVRQLAAELTKDATNPYDKAKKIEDYLRITFPYSNKPDLTKGRSRDFVDRFLFEIKEGYCDYYSSAMAVMSRSVGLPTRWVKGYASGLSAMSQEEALGFLGDQGGLVDPDAAGVYTVRNADAHSWVEVYFSGYGWVPFEPTAGFALPRATIQEELPAETSTQTAAPVEPEEPADMSRHVQWMSMTGLGLLAAAIVAFLGWKFQILEVIRERLERRRASLLKQKVIVECERLLRICRRNGYVRQEHETLREAVRRWTQQSKWMKADLEQILSIFEKAKYSKADITEQDWQQAAQIVEKLRSQF